MSSNIPHKSGIPKPATAATVAPRSTVSSAPTESKMPSNWSELEAMYKADIEALTESTEMATIEKEIAEENLENCKREIQDLKDKLAEASTQIDTLQKEQHANQTESATKSESAVTVYQLQKVEEQNELLKQALLKLRDISAKDKKGLEDLQIEHEELQEKMLVLEEKEQKYLEQIKIYEEQIDVSQSAQEMVEKLTQQKTELEDKLREMVDDIDCMEKLRDLNEQLLESARENEVELTGELDKLRVQYAELTNEKRDIEDYLLDQERTVTKLKEENRQMNDQINILKNQFKEGESIQQQRHQIENVAYKLNFSESKMAEKEAEIVRCRRNLVEMEEQMNSLSIITKEQAARIDELRIQLDTKVSENSELQRALKKKMEEVSELEIRREMAEKKLQANQRDSETKLVNLKRTIDTMKGIEVQHEEDIKRLMEDNEMIERERRELRDQLNKSNRSLERSMQAGNHSISMVTAHDTSLASLGISLQATPPAQVSTSHSQQASTLQQLNQSINFDKMQPTQATSLTSVAGPARCMSLGSDVSDSFLLDKINELSAAFDRVNKQNYELEMELAMRELNSRIPPYAGSSFSSYLDKYQVKTLQAEVRKLDHEVKMAMINQTICTNSRNIVSHMRNEKFKNSRLLLKYQSLENDVSALMSTSSLARLRPKAPLLQSTPVK